MWSREILKSNAKIALTGRYWRAFVVALLVMMVLIIGIVVPRFRRVQKLVDKINSVARENLTGINVVHAYNAEDYQN